jgi:hypothetical protein
MNFHLIVVQGFGPHAKGDRVTDATEVATILAGENASHVVRIPAPAAPAPATKEA